MYSLTNTTVSADSVIRRVTTRRCWCRYADAVGGASAQPMISKSTS